MSISYKYLNYLPIPVYSFPTVIVIINSIIKGANAYKILLFITSETHNYVIKLLIISLLHLHHVLDTFIVTLWLCIFYMILHISFYSCSCRLSCFIRNFVLIMTSWECTVHTMVTAVMQITNNAFYSIFQTLSDFSLQSLRGLKI
jgi:hypothetical protein